MAASPSDPAHSPAASHVHMHGHGAETPHPAQSPPWSILRMTLLARLGVAVLLSAVLWAAVLTAMR